MSSTDAGQHLVDIHDHLRRELSQVRDIVAQVLGGAERAAGARSHIATMTLRQNDWTMGAYCQSYCRLLTGHHSLEDASMLPHLRRSEPELGPVIDRLEVEHRAIHATLDALDRALVAYIGDAGRADELREALDVLTDTLLSHLSYEEHQLVEPLARHGYGF